MAKNVEDNGTKKTQYLAVDPGSFGRGLFPVSVKKKRGRNLGNNGTISNIQNQVKNETPKNAERFAFPIAKGRGEANQNAKNCR